MSVNIKFNWNKPTKQIVEEATGGDKTLKFMAVTWHKLYYPFIPMDTGTMADNVEYDVEGNYGVIRHKAPYSSRMYDGRGFDFRRDKHPLASAAWDGAAKAAGKGEILARDTQNFVRRG